MPTPLPLQPPTSFPPDIDAPVIQPVFVKQLPESPDLHGAIVSPDGQSIWALAEAPIIDVGKLLNQHALVCASTIAALLAAFIIPWLWRSARRRRIPGAMHCRKCDYNVSAAPAGTCPECGSDLARKRPRPGRGVVRRIWLPLSLLLLVTGALGWFIFDGHKRYPQPLPEYRWTSALLQRWTGVSWLAWMQNASTGGDLLLELDARTGLTRRTITTRSTRTYWPLQYNRAAHGVYLAADNGDLLLVSIKDGSTIASLQGHTWQFSAIEAPHIAGHSADGRLVYLSCASYDTGRSWLTEWDWKTGATRRLATSEPFQASTPSPVGTTMPVAHPFLMVPGMPLRFVCYPTFMETFTSGTYNLSVLDGDGKVISTKNLGKNINTNGIPAFSQDGGMIFFIHHYGEAVDAFDTTTLKSAGSLPLEKPSGWGTVSVRPDGRVMLLPVSHSILVRDSFDLRWVGRLAHPANCIAPRSIYFADDGLTVSAVFQVYGSSGRGRASNAFQLGVWKLPESLRITPPK